METEHQEDATRDSNNEVFPHCTLRRRILIISLLLVRITPEWKHGQREIFDCLIHRGLAESATEKPDRKFWEDSGSHLSLSYGGRFQNITARDLEDQFNHLTWCLSLRPEILSKTEPRLPKRKFPWEERWILACWGSGTPLSVQSFPRTFGHGVDWTEFAALLSSSPLFPSGISVENLIYEVDVIRDVLEGPDDYSVPKPAGPDHSQSLQQPTSGANKSELHLPKRGLRKRQSSQGLQPDTKKRSEGSRSSPGKGEPDKAQLVV